MIKPPRLRPGDRVATISLSWGGAGAFPHRYEAGKRQIEEEYGLEVVETEHSLASPEFLADHPEARAADLMAAFADPSIKGIFSNIGGDDSIRILPHVDLESIRANPKVVVGFSDTTITHFLCRKAGLVSFYGPSVLAGFAESAGMFPYLAESFRRAVFHAEPMGVIEPNPEGWTVEFASWEDPATQTRRRILQPSTGWTWLQERGVARGPLIGGCIDVLEFLKGTPLWPAPEEWDGAILFLETSEDGPSPTSVTRWLRNYAAQGILHRLSAILFGRPGGQIDPAAFKDYDEVIRRVVAVEQGLGELPIVTGMDFGHTEPFMTLPMGVLAEVDGERRTFSIVEAAVT
jgi:muramoyltetrapeptide carboxypeptidase LdcA involved in peptidoglycan recycling